MNKNVMKKLAAVCFMGGMVLMLTACGNKEESSSTAQSASSTTVESGQAKSEQEGTEAAAATAAVSADAVDLTALSSTMVYAEVNNMMVDPESYVGRPVTMEGQFTVIEGEERNYYACVIADATSCCAQGIEFVLDGEYSYPQDYPEIGSTITVTGVFDTYTEGESMYCQLISASMI